MHHLPAARLRSPPVRAARFTRSTAQPNFAHLYRKYTISSLYVTIKATEYLQFMSRTNNVVPGHKNGFGTTGVHAQRILHIIIKYYGSLCIRDSHHQRRCRGTRCHVDAYIL